MRLLQALLAGLVTLYVLVLALPRVFPGMGSPGRLLDPVWLPVLVAPALVVGWVAWRRPSSWAQAFRRRPPSC